MSIAFLAVAAVLPMLYLERVSVTSLARARHVWLWLVGGLALTVVLPREPWLGVIGAYLLVWWRAPARTDPLGRAPYEKTRVVVWWVAIGTAWAIALTVPPWVWTWLPLVWGGWAWLLAAAMVSQCRGRRDPQKVRGWLGQRSVAGAWLALILPLLPLWAWPGPLIGLYLSGPSYVAVAALATAAVVRWPSPLVWGVLGAAGGLAVLLMARAPMVGRHALFEWLPRGDSLDSLWQRAALWRLAWRTRAWAGTGPGTTAYLHLQAAARGHLAEATGTLHNEPLQFVSEYGLLGAVALGLFVARVAPHLRWADPWSACVVAGAVMALGSMALRVPSIGALWLVAAAEVAHGSA